MWFASHSSTVLVVWYPRSANTFADVSMMALRRATHFGPRSSVAAVVGGGAGAASARRRGVFPRPVSRTGFARATVTPLEHQLSMGHRNGARWDQCGTGVGNIV